MTDPNTPPRQLANNRRVSTRTLAIVATMVTALIAIGVMAAIAFRPDSTAPQVVAATSAAARATPANCPNGRLANGDCVGESAAATPALGDDRVAWEVCPAILRAADAIRDPNTMEPLGKLAATSQDLSLATSGQLLADRARLARNAKGTSLAQTTISDMSATATDLATMCTKAGFKP